MVSTGEAVVYLGGGLLAAEATGVTNLSGGDGSGGDESGGGGGGIPPGLLAALTGGDGGPSVVDLPDTPPGRGMDMGALAALLSSRAGGRRGGIDPSALRSFVTDTVRSTRTGVDRAADAATGATSPWLAWAQSRTRGLTNAASGGLPNVPTPDLPFTGGGGGGGGGRPGPSGGGDGFDLQDLAGTGPLGTTAATVGESGAAAGSAVNDATTGAGNIIGDPGAALRGESPGGVLGVSFESGQVAGAAVNSLVGGAESAASDAADAVDRSGDPFTGTIMSVAPEGASKSEVASAMSGSPYTPADRNLQEAAAAAPAYEGPTKRDTEKSPLPAGGLGPITVPGFPGGA